MEVQYLTLLIVTCIRSTGISTWEAQEDTGSATYGQGGGGLLARLVGELGDRALLRY